MRVVRRGEMERFSERRRRDDVHELSRGDVFLGNRRAVTVRVQHVSARDILGRHVLHPDSDCTPVAEEYVPAGQFVHVATVTAL